jgi:hypothetical protein
LLDQTSGVCLTPSIWSGNAKEDYRSVVFHFIIDDWELEKRIISIRMIDYSHTGVNIAECMLLVIF